MVGWSVSVARVVNRVVKVFGVFAFVLVVFALVFVVFIVLCPLCRFRRWSVCRTRFFLLTVGRWSVGCVYPVRLSVKIIITDILFFVKGIYKKIFSAFTAKGGVLCFGGLSAVSLCPLFALCDIGGGGYGFGGGVGLADSGSRSISHILPISQFKKLCQPLKTLHFKP